MAVSSGIPGALGAFLGQLARPRTSLSRALVPLLIAKVCVILLAKVFVFGGENRIEVTPALMERQTLGLSTVSPGETNP